MRIIGDNGGGVDPATLIILHCEFCDCKDDYSALRLKTIEQLNEMECRSCGLSTEAMRQPEEEDEDES